MKPAALGFRVHSGWTSLIALALENNQPIILARQRPHLVATFSYTFRQPYHTAEKMDLAEARTFLDQQRGEAQTRARSTPRRANRSRPARLQTNSRRTAPSLRPPAPRTPKILASHSIIHTADGEFFREALLHACARADLCRNKNQRTRTPRHCLHLSSSQSRRAHPFHQRPRQTTRLPLDPGRKIRHPRRLARSGGKPLISRSIATIFDL